MPTEDYPAVEAAVQQEVTAPMEDGRKSTLTPEEPAMEPKSMSSSVGPPPAPVRSSSLSPEPVPTHHTTTPQTSPVENKEIVYSPPISDSSSELSAVISGGEVSSDSDDDGGPAAHKDQDRTTVSAIINLISTMNQHLAGDAESAELMYTLPSTSDDMKGQINTSQVLASSLTRYVM